MESTCCAPGSDTCGNPCRPAGGAVVLPSCANLLLLPIRVAAVTLKSSADIVRRTFDGTLAEPESCCTVPESDCPNPCVAVVHWEGCPGDRFSRKFHLKNTSKQTSTFKLSAENFACTEQAVTVAPVSKSLSSEQTLQGTLSFQIPESFAGGLYRAKVRIEGAYVQWLLICLKVRNTHACCIYVEQGDVPVRVKAHHWYHHFQCEELCDHKAERL